MMNKVQRSKVADAVAQAIAYIEENNDFREYDWHDDNAFNIESVNVDVLGDDVVVIVRNDHGNAYKYAWFITDRGDIIADGL